MADRRATRERRGAGERRRRSRRRKSDARIFVIEITRAELRVALLERSTAAGEVDRVSAWTSIWRKESAALESPEGLAELTAAFRDVARRHNMFTADVRIVLSGAYCVTRTVRGTVDEVRHELQQLEQRSRLYLSLGPGEKVLVSHTRLLDARHAHALAAACNKATLETVQTAAELAGIEITLIEPGLSALTRAVSRLPEVPTEPYLLVHLADEAAEIAICHEGRLLLDYRPGGATGTADLPALLANHLNRLNRHVARYMRTSGPGLKNVFLSGEDGAVQLALQQFQRRSPLEVRPVLAREVQATWQLQKEAATAASAPTLGGLLLSYLPADDVDAPNLMQHIIEGRQEPLRPRLLRSAIPIAATLFIAASLGAINTGERTGLEAMQLELDGLGTASAKATELRLQLVGNEAKLAQLRQLAAKLPAGLGNDEIKYIGACMPGDVWLTTLLLADRSAATLQGASYLEAGVYDFVRWLEQAPGFTEVALKRTSATASSSGPATSFELELTLGKSNDQATRVARHE